MSISSSTPDADLHSGQTAHRLRLLIVIHSSDFGGGATMVEILCRELAARYAITVVCDGAGELPNTVRQLGAEVVAIPLSTKGMFTRSIPELARTVRRQSPDVVHLVGQFAGSLGQLALLLAGRPPSVYNAQWPSYLSDRGSLTRARNWLAERISCSLATVVVPTSKHDARELVRRRMCSASRLVIIPNSFMVRERQEGSEPLPGPRDRPRILFVGRLVDQKGCEYLIGAMPEILRRHPRAVLQIVGDGPDRATLESAAAAAGVGQAVEFAGYQRDPYPWLAAADVVAIPSVYEPFGIVALEAMAAGRPVVASAVGGLQELVTDGETGTLVPPRNTGAIAAAVSGIIDDPDLADRLGRAGKARVHERFNPSAVSAQFDHLYRSIARRRG